MSLIDKRFLIGVTDKSIINKHDNSYTGTLGDLLTKLEHVDQIVDLHPCDIREEIQCICDRIKNHCSFAYENNSKIAKEISASVYELSVFASALEFCESGHEIFLIDMYEDDKTLIELCSYWFDGVIVVGEICCDN